MVLDVILLVAGFVAGVLVGRANAKTVSAVVSASKKV